MRFRLTYKLILVSLFFLLVIFASITIEVVHTDVKNLRTSLQNDSKSFAALAVQPIGETFLTFQNSGTFQIKTQIQQSMSQDPDISNIGIVDIDGTTVYSQNPGFPSSINASTASSFSPVDDYGANGFIQTIYQPFIEDTGIHQYEIVYDISSASMETSLHQVETSTILLGLVGLILSAILTYGLLSWLFINPIDQISRQALLISSGKLDAQIRMLRKDEIGDLAVAVNTMATSLKADIKKLQEVDSLKSEFMMISSHNLRTPLTVIDSYLEQLDSLSLSKEAAELIEIVGANTKRLKVFAENMLIIAQMEAGRNDPDSPTMINSNDFFTQIGEQLKTLGSAKHIQVNVSLPTDLPNISVQKRKFNDALWNIADNALKFTSAGGLIEFNVLVNGSELLIEIKDNGIGISDEEIPKLFTKFHRGTSVMRYDYEGTGIGLYLAKLIIEQQNGKIAITSKQAKGTTVTITLPLNTASPLDRA